MSGVTNYAANATNKASVGKRVGYFLDQYYVWYR